MGRLELALTLAVAGTVFTAATCDAQAQFWDRLKARASDTVDRVIDRQTDRVMDRALEKGEPRTPVAGQRGGANGPPAGTTEGDDTSGKPAETAGATAGRPTSATAGASGDAVRAGGVGSATAAGRSRSRVVESGAYTRATRYDFVPGEKPLLADDFSHDRAGEFPHRWTSGGGNIEVVELDGQKWVALLTRDAELVWSPRGGLPEHVTVEFDVRFREEDGLDVWFHMPAARPHLWSRVVIAPWDRKYGVLSDVPSLTSTTTLEPRDFALGRPHRVQIALRGPSAKVYVDGRRVANHPEVSLGRDGVYLSSWSDTGILISNLTVAEGGRPLTERLASGRAAVRGIAFATGSDRIEPESNAVIRELVEALRDADGRFVIEGHTDAVGPEAANTSLSERRAAAVKARLVAEGIDARRLRTAGFGFSQPVGPNDSPEGRAMNRRVEVVRLK